jgi:serine/threonine protein kinase
MLLQGYYFGDKADLWSIGCILLELALGHRRFCLYWMRAYSFDVIQDHDAFFKRITSTVNSVLSSEMLRVNEEYEEFLVQFLRLRSSDRPTFKRIAQHPWLRGLFPYQPNQESHSNDSHEEESLGIGFSQQQSSSIPRYNTMAPSLMTTDSFAQPVCDSEAMSPAMMMHAPIGSPTGQHPANSGSGLGMPHTASYNMLPSDSQNNGFNNDLVSSLFDHLTELTVDFPSPQMEAYKKSMEENMTNDASGPASEASGVGENETFRLPPSTNWKNLFHNGPNESNEYATADGRANWGSRNMRGIHASSHQHRPESTLKTKVRVLLVEDSAFQRKLMAKRIQMVGLVNGGPDQWEVVQCSDGESALTVSLLLWI